MLLETGVALPQEPWEFHAEQRSAQMSKNDQRDFALPGRSDVTACADPVNPADVNVSEK